MFQKILGWFREWINKMIGNSSIREALHIDVAISPYMAEALLLWSYMYQNRAFWLNDQIRSLHLPSAIAGEISRAVTIEMKVEITGSARAKYLQEQMDRVLPKLRQVVEYGAAKGGLMFKPWINGENIDVDYVQADMFYPIAYDANGGITSAVFADTRTLSNHFYTRLEYHALTSKGYEIRNQAFKSDSRNVLGQPCSLTEVEAWAELQPDATVTGIDKPLFAYFKYPMANNIDPVSPLGVSCYSRVVNLIEQADKQWSELMWEFESGKRAIYVDELAFHKDSLGNPILPDRRLYRTMVQGGELTSEEMFHEWSPEFREVSIKSGLDSILKRIEFNCGLAYGVLSDPQAIDKTATELMITQQRSYATITDTQKALKSALENLLYAMDVWATIGNIAPRGNYATDYDFDDSVIVDKNAQMQADRQTVTLGAMPKWRFLVRNYGIKEEEAKQWIADTQAEQPEDLFSQGQGGK